eukprot:g7747.t1
MVVTANDPTEALQRAIAACRICRERPLGGPGRELPHEPRPVVVISSTARLLIAGQAPGLRVHESGLPFNDASGNRLRDWMGVTRDEFYDASRIAIVPMGFCFPGYDARGSDLPPRRECAPAWRSRVMAAMPQIETVLVIGQYAAAWHLGARRRPSTTETVRNWRDYFMVNQGPRILPLPHPSWRNSGWLKRNPWFEDEEDSTLAVADLAKKVGLSTTPCWRRIQKMEEDGVIRRRVALLDPVKVNTKVTVFVSIRTASHSIEWLKRFSEVVVDFPEVIEFYRMSGDVDYLLKVVVPDIAAYDAFYKRLIAKIEIRDVSSVFAMEQIKYTTELPLDYMMLDNQKAGED